MKGKTKEMGRSILDILYAGKGWMTADEIIRTGHKKGVMEPKDMPGRLAKSHPAYRVLTGMCRKDCLDVYSPDVRRRIHTGLDQKHGMYEYSIRPWRRVLNAISGLIRH